MQFGPDGDAKEPHSKGEIARTTTSNGLFYNAVWGECHTISELGNR